MQERTIVTVPTIIIVARHISTTATFMIYDIRVLASPFPDARQLRCASMLAPLFMVLASQLKTEACLMNFIKDAI